MAILQCVRYKAIDKQGHQSMMARIKMFNSGEMFKEKSLSDGLSIPVSCSFLIRNTSYLFFSKSCEIFQFILCALHSLRV